jgi:hypothetical protein
MQWKSKRSQRMAKKSCPNGELVRFRPRLQSLESRVVPTPFTVTNANDAGPGSLRQAILDTNAMTGLDTISFDPTFFATPRTINLLFATGELRISDDLTITGPGIANLTIDGGNNVRIFEVNKANAIAAVTLSGMTLTHGIGNTGGAVSVAGDGGAVLEFNENLTLENMVIRGNSTAGINDGGGIATTSNPILTIRNCTISGNTTNGAGGGIYFFNGGSLLMENSTVSGNVARDSIGGGGIYFYGTVSADGFTIRNCTIAGNNAPSGSGGGVVFPNLNVPAGVSATIQNSTITNNTSGTSATAFGQGGGGIAIPSGSASSILRIQSTILSGNFASIPNGHADFSTIQAAVNNVYNCAIGDGDGFTLSASSSGNLFGANLHLLALANYGGPTQTVALGAGSMAVDHGSNPAALAFDQRGSGFPRQLGSQVDIGAVEGVTNPPSAVASGLVNVTVAGSNNPYAISVTYSDTFPIDIGTLDNQDIRITGPNGFNVLATLGTVNASNPNSVVANYSFVPPANPTPGWDAGDNGTYAVFMEGSQVSNTNSLFVPPSVLGNFNVAIPVNFVVTNLGDAGIGSLRQAILQRQRHRSAGHDHLSAWFDRHDHADFGRTSDQPAGFDQRPRRRGADRERRRHEPRFSCQQHDHLHLRFDLRPDGHGRQRQHRGRHTRIRRWRCDFRLRRKPDSRRSRD